MTDIKRRLKSTPTRHAYRAIFVAAFLSFVLAFLSWPTPSDQAVHQIGQWTTFGHDPQRSGWATDEHTFTRQNVSRLGLAWRATLPNEPRALNGLTAPLVVRNVATDMRESGVTSRKSRHFRSTAGASSSAYSTP